MKKIFSFSFLIISLVFATPIKTHSYRAFDDKYNYNEYNTSITYNYSPGNEEILLIVDFSNSMILSLQGRKRIDIAIEAIDDILRNMDQSKKIGLRIFGFSRGEITPGGIQKITKEAVCTSSSLVVPISSYNANNISAKLRQYNPSGATPIGYSLRQAVNNDFSYGSSLKHIILITDGGENCGDNPCEYIKKLMTERKDIKIDVVGITLSKNEYSQLNCISSVSGGTFQNIENADEFRTKVKQAIESRTDEQAQQQYPTLNFTQSAQQQNPQKSGNVVPQKTVKQPVTNQINYKKYSITIYN